MHHVRCELKKLRLRGHKRKNRKWGGGTLSLGCYASWKCSTRHLCLSVGLGGGNLLLGKIFGLDGRPDKVFPGFNQSRVSSTTTRGYQRLCHHIGHRQGLFLQLWGSKDGMKKFWWIKALADWCAFSQIKVIMSVTCWACEMKQRSFFFVWKK